MQLSGGTNNVGSAQINDDSIVNQDINSAAAIAGSKLQALSVGANAGVIPSTGVADAHVAAAAAISADKINNMAYAQLASVTLGSAATTISSGTITAKKHLRILLYIAGSAAGADLGLQFNGDTGNNYLWNTAKDQGAVTVPGSLDKLKLSSGAVTQERLAIIDIYNVATINKLVRVTVVSQDDVWEGGGQWTNTANQITSIVAMLDAAGNISSGTNMVVLGMD